MSTPASSEIEFAGETLALLADRAVWWPRARTLFVADTHLGKPSAFRAAGIPVPEHATAHDLDRLTSLIEATSPDRLVVLGDLVHARAGTTPALVDDVAAWRSSHDALAIDLVVGNHDRGAGATPAAWRIREIEPGATLDPFTLIHDPADHTPGTPSLSGHLHPAVRLTGVRSQRGARLPAFIVSPSLIVLPAFGRFTGTCVVRPGAEDRAFALAEGDVIELTPPRPHASAAHRA